MLTVDAAKRCSLLVLFLRLFQLRSRIHVQGSLQCKILSTCRGKGAGVKNIRRMLSGAVANLVTLLLASLIPSSPAPLPFHH